jgi:hypothetical protein
MKAWPRGRGQGARTADAKQLPVQDPDDGGTRRLPRRRRRDDQQERVWARAGGALSGRPSRRLWVVAAVTLPILAAAVAGATHAQPTLRYTAAATIVVEGDRGGIAGAARQERRARLVKAVVELPEVLAAARTMVASDRSVGELADQTEVRSVPGEGLIRLSVHEKSEREALSIANAIAVQALYFARRVSTSQGGTTVVGDFEEPLSEWGATPSRFNIPPRLVGGGAEGARVGSRTLRVVCPPTPPCGPVVKLYQHFRRGVTYIAEGWARSAGRVRLEMVFGASPRDVSTGPQRRLVGGWQRLAVRWTPAANRSSAELGVRTTSPGGAVYEIDGVRLFDPVGVSTRGLQGSPPLSIPTSFENTRFATVSSALPTGKIESHMDTLKWTVGGALAGLALVVAAFGCGAAASRAKLRG